MNRLVKKSIETLAPFTLSRVEVGEVVEFGSRCMLGQEDFANLRGVFAGHNYVGIDYIDGPGVDSVQDIMALELSDDSVDMGLCLEVLEHVQNPSLAVSELRRVLRSGGVLIVTVPMNMEIHGSPFDYWRFTPEGLGVLLADFKYTEIRGLGSEKFPTTIIAIVSDSPEVMTEQLKGELDDLVRESRPPSERVGLRQIVNFLKLFLPLIFIDSNFEFFRRRQHGSKLSAFRELIWLFQPNFIRKIIQAIRLSGGYTG